MKVKVHLVKAFTKDKNQGNPAGVILNADNLSSEQMLSISSSLGFSESAFVHKSNKADFKLRFFSPIKEVSLCAHATIATFHTLVKNNIISLQKNPEVKTQETKAGVLPVMCYSDSLIMMGQNQPQFFEPEKNKGEIASLLSLEKDDLLNFPIQTVSTGVPKLVIPVTSIKKLWDIKPNLEKIAIYCKENNTQGFYPFTQETQTKTASFHTRQFNPLAGINEDPITGLAGGALGCYAKKYGLINNHTFIIEQGFVLKKGGFITIDLSDGVKAGGYAISFGEKILEL